MATATAAEILLYGTIGEEITDRAFARDLDDLRNEPEIDVRINSGGGSVPQGLAMHSAIVRARQRGQRVTTWNDGACFSMAAVVFQAGTTRIIADNALLMLHSPFTDQGGDANELRKKAGALDKVESQLVDIVATRSRQPVATVKKWLTAETWFDASEAIAFGLADRRYTERSEHDALAGLIFAQYKVPSRYLARLRGPIESAVADIELTARVARRATIGATFNSFKAQAIRAAEKLTSQTGVRNDDLRRVTDALDSIDASEDWPRDWRY